jgi:hypothetical protein
MRVCCVVSGPVHYDDKGPDTLKRRGRDPGQCPPWPPHRLDRVGEIDCDLALFLRPSRIPGSFQPFSLFDPGRR